MRRSRRRTLHAVLAVALLAPLTGCLSSNGLLLALTQDLSLTSAAATQGLVTGWLTNLGLR
jgi:hypothetical protein